MRIAGAVTPRLVLGLFLPASFAVFFVGLLSSSAFYFRTRPIDLKAAVISDVESPGDNPHGYGAAAAGTAACGLLLAPAAALFYQRLRVVRRRLTVAGSLLFAAGLASATAIGLLAPFTRGYTPLHIQLAFAAFIGICGGTLILLFVAAGMAREAGRGLRRAASGIAALNSLVLAFLLYMYFGPEILNNDGLLTSLAFCEWMLCVDCALSLWILAAVIARTPTRSLAVKAGE
jgi:hypothetical protein